MIRHTVTFRLHHDTGSVAEQEFLAAAQALAEIPGVESFEQLRQTSAQSSFTHGLLMEFADPAAYDAYDHHPAHVAFVAERWTSEVAEFIELDYEPL